MALWHYNYGITYLAHYRLIHSQVSTIYTVKEKGSIIIHDFSMNFILLTARRFILYVVHLSFLSRQTNISGERRGE